MGRNDIHVRDLTRKTAVQMIGEHNLKCFGCGGPIELEEYDIGLYRLTMINGVFYCQRCVETREILMKLKRVLDSFVNMPGLLEQLDGRDVPYNIITKLVDFTDKGMTEHFKYYLKLLVTEMEKTGYAE